MDQPVLVCGPLTELLGLLDRSECYT
jgi:hypothetical protein